MILGFVCGYVCIEPFHRIVEPSSIVWYVWLYSLLETWSNNRGSRKIFLMPYRSCIKTCIAIRPTMIAYVERTFTTYHNDYHIQQDMYTVPTSERK